MTIYCYSWIFGFFLGFINIGTAAAAHGLIDRDLLLTPKEGLQVHGKSIFYQEPDYEVILRNQSSVAWDRTLKHVTFVALFPDAASNGNLSKSKEYEDFLESPYIKQKEQKHPRFGDIVTLAQGRLEKDEKIEQFRFVEGLCENLCEVKNILALWQVQKIRHRDRNRKFRYEMKFSIRPWYSSVDSKRSDSGKRATSESNQKRIAKSKSFILKDDDYPRSFGRLSYEERETERRSDDFGPRNFRQTPAEPYFRKILNLKDFARGATSAIESPVSEENLNIGEYVNVFNPRATNIGLLTPTPTTYRPNYHEKFLRPPMTTTTSETDILSHEQKFKFPNLLEDEPSSSLSDETHSPIITHHFHHHYYMQRPEEAASPKPPFQSERENEKFTINYQLPMTTSTTASPLDEIIANVAHFAPFSVAEGEIVNLPKSEVTGKYYRMFPIRIGPELPLIIYPASSSSTGKYYNRKPFIQSEPEEEEIRYSDPDPLYDNPPDLNVSSESYEVKSSQLESPQVLQHDNGLQRNLEISTLQEKSGKHETQESSTIEPMILKIPTAVNEMTTIATIFGTSSDQVNTISSTSTSSTTAATKQGPTPPPPTTTTTDVPPRTFSVHKIRYGYRRTTTEKPVLRWIPKKASNDSNNQTNHDDQYSVASQANSSNITTNQPTTILEEQIITLIPSPTQSSAKFDQQNSERIEILTQKSVSKSVSVKVGNQLKEIPVTEEFIEVSESTDKIDNDKSSNNANSNLI